MKAITVIFGELDSKQRNIIKQEVKKQNIALNSTAITSKKSVLQKISVEQVDVIVVSGYGSSNKRFSVSDVMRVTQEFGIRVIYLLQSITEYTDDELRQLYDNHIYDVLFLSDINEDNISKLIICGRSQQEAMQYMKLNGGEKMFSPLSDSVMSNLNHYIKIGMNEEDMVQTFHS